MWVADSVQIGLNSTRRRRPLLLLIRSRTDHVSEPPTLAVIIATNRTTPQHKYVPGLLCSGGSSILVLG